MSYWHAELGADGKDYRADFVHASFPKILSSRVRYGLKSPNSIGLVMTATLNKTPILFAALLTVATPAFAGDWRTIPEGVGTDGVCTLYNQNLECMDAARTFLASSGEEVTIRMRRQCLA